MSYYKEVVRDYGQKLKRMTTLTKAEGEKRRRFYRERQQNDLRSLMVVGTAVRPVVDQSAFEAVEAGAGFTSHQSGAAARNVRYSSSCFV